jgi:putative aldouronate transport system substrate-binding protein
MRNATHRLTLLFLVMAALLAACGQAAPAAPGGEVSAQPTDAAAAPTTAAAPTEASESAEQASGEPVDLEMWLTAAVSEAGPPPDDWVAYEIIREQLGINLKVTLLPSDFSDQDAKINAAAASNTLPDFFNANRDVWARLVDAGLIAPVKDLLPLMPKRTERYYTNELRNTLATVNGELYGLAQPSVLPRTDGLVIRQDWLDKLGLKAPTTTEEFLAVAKAFTEQDPDGNGQNDTYGFGAFIESPGIYSMGLGPRFEFLYGAYGVAGVFDVSSTDSFGLNVRKPEFRQATEFIKQLNDARVIDPDWPTLKKDEFRARWKQGRYGMMIESFAALSTVANYKDFDANFPEGEWAAIPPPKGPGGESANGLTYENVRIYAVSQRAMEAGKGEAIARLLEWLATDEGYYLLGFGQEGVNYKLDADGNVMTEGIAPELAWTSKEVQPLTQLRNLVYYNSDVELHARYVPHKTKNGRTLEPLKYYEQISTQPYTEATAATIILPPANGADFTRFYSENLVNFALGQQPLSEQTWGEYLAGLDGLGARDLEAAAKQTVLDAGFLK